jgi:tetratricopeptide (TPR) repeat protein
MKRCGYLVLFLFIVGLQLAAPIEAQEEGKLVGTWCSLCNRLIPAGETCIHMRGESSPSGRERREESIRETRFAEIRNRGINLYNSASRKNPREAISRCQKALRCYEEALGYKPGDEYIQRLIKNANARIALAEAMGAFNSGDYDRALLLFRSAVDQGGLLYDEEQIAQERIAQLENIKGTGGNSNASQPNTVLGDNGRYYPAEGYRWVHPDDPNDFSVEPIPGTPNIEHPNTVWGEGGEFHPAPGYRWAHPDDPNDFSVEPIPGTPNSEHPNTVWDEGGGFHPAPGYRWARPDDPNDFSVEPIPVTPEKEPPNTISDEKGKIRPAPGFRWARPDDPKDFSVLPTAGQKDEENHALLGTQLQEQGRYEEAATEFRLALELAPDNSTYARKLGKCLQIQYGALAAEMINSSDFSGAAAAYEHLLAEMPRNDTAGRGECHTQLGTAQSRISGEEPKAYANLKTGAVLNSESAASYRALGEFLMNNGLYAEALRVLKRSKELAEDAGLTPIINLAESKALQETKAAEDQGLIALGSFTIAGLREKASKIFDDPGTDISIVDLRETGRPFVWPQSLKDDPRFKQMRGELESLQSAEQKLETELLEIQQKRLSAHGSARAPLALIEEGIKARLFQAEYDRKIQEKRIKNYIIDPSK